MSRILFLSTSLLAIFAISTAQLTVVLDGSTYGRQFDGIGGLSGGGATSRLLIDYDEPYRSQILDYLFLPGFGASLNIIKVEIGGDCQTTDGTEPSHMHTREDENYQRGYEWWLLTEAKKRNPYILTYALSWGVPQWVGNGNFFSDDNVDYHIRWLQGAKKYYDIDIDFTGIWNERPFTDDANCTYIKKLRAAMDANGLENVQLVGADGDWGIIPFIQNDPEVAKAIAIVGVHYPGTNSSLDAQNLKKRLWSSEDYSTYADNVGGGCWGRILNQNYVNGYMTSTIAWNLIAAYDPDLPYSQQGLMWASYPWSNTYTVQSPIWVTAHTTQFAEPGWYYLAHGTGVGMLPLGGSYVTLVPDSGPHATRRKQNINAGAGDFSMIIETFTHDRSICIRPELPPFDVEAQTITFQLQGGLKQDTLHVWFSYLAEDEDDSIYFQQGEDIVVNEDGTFNLLLEINHMYTVTTTTGQMKGAYPISPPYAPFPQHYYDTFDDYQPESEPHYFADQTGSFAALEFNGAGVMAQVVQQEVNSTAWCAASKMPITLIGQKTMSDYRISVDAMINATKGVVSLGARVQTGGCADSYQAGYFLFVDEGGDWNFTVGENVVQNGEVAWDPSSFHTLSIIVNGELITVFIDQQVIYKGQDASWGNGWGSIGSGYHYAIYNNFSLNQKDD